LIVAVFADGSADATAATVALGPRTSRATAASTIRLFALLAIGISFLLIRFARSEREVVRAGYTLLLAETHDAPERELRAIRDLLSRRVDGVILAPSAEPMTALGLLGKRGVPIVLIDRLVPVELDQIATENIAPTARLVEHLVELGHERIGMVAGLQGLTTSEERIEGYRRGLASSSLPFDPELVVRGDSDAEPARAVVGRLLGLERPPTALVVGNNRMTIGVMRGLREASLTVPDDMALVGFDDFEWADLFHPRLTTIAQATAQMGEQSVSMLLSRLADPGLVARKVQLEPRFVHRDSCGCRTAEPEQAGSDHGRPAATAAERPVPAVDQE
jgi:LacI family transcriptional regulator